MESKFTGSPLGYFGMKMLAIPMMFLGFFTLGLALAWFKCFYMRWVCKHTYIDGRQQRFDGKTFPLWIQNLIWTILVAITFGIYIFFLSVRRRHWFTSHTHFA